MKPSHTQKQPPKNSPSPLRPVNTVLNGYSLRDVLLKSRKIKAIEDYLKTAIAPEWGPYYHVQNLKGNTLVISATHSSAAQKMRLNSLDWLFALRQAHWPFLASIHINVCSPTPQPTHAANPTLTRSISDHSANKLQSIAIELENPELQQSCLKLAQILRATDED